MIGCIKSQCKGSRLANPTLIIKLDKIIYKIPEQFGHHERDITTLDEIPNRETSALKLNPANKIFGRLLKLNPTKKYLDVC